MPARMCWARWARTAARRRSLRTGARLPWSAPDILDRVIGAWPHTRAVRSGGRLIIAIDGKAVRGAKGKDGKAPHPVAALAPSWIGFAGAAQVAQLRRTLTQKGKKTVGVVYLVTSDRDASPATLAAWVRGHWR
jgi:hypothetical protein